MNESASNTRDTALSKLSEAVTRIEALADAYLREQQRLKSSERQQEVASAG